MSFGNALFRVGILLLLFGGGRVIPNGNAVGSAPTPGLTPINPSSPVPPPPSQPKSVSGIPCEEVARASLVTVQVTGGEQGGLGSGTVVSNNPNLVLTNHHVVEGETPQMAVKWIDGQKYRAKTIAKVGQREGDMALLQVDAPTPLTPIKLAASLPKPGDKVIAMGSPYGEEGIITTGTFTSTQGIDTLSAISIKPGNSGGPLLNEQCEQIALNKGVPPDQGQAEESGQPVRNPVGISTSLDTIKAFIAKHSKQ